MLHSWNNAYMGQCLMNISLDAATLDTGASSVGDDLRHTYTKHSPSRRCKHPFNNAQGCALMGGLVGSASTLTLLQSCKHTAQLHGVLLVHFGVARSIYASHTF